MLSKATGALDEVCKKAIEQHLLHSYEPEVADPETQFPPFAFRLHQFVSRGDTVHTSLQPESDRYLTLEAQQYVPGDRGRVLLPLVFCRECGQEYYCVDLQGKEGSRVAVPRAVGDIAGDDDQDVESCFLYSSTDAPWPEEEAEIVERVPDEWVEEHHGTPRVKPANRNRLPRSISLGADGVESGAGSPFILVPAPFRFCLRCGVTYGSGRLGDYTKLATLATEGRSTATTVLSLSAVRHLRSDTTLPQDARKLLSFTDNGQDASLQAGHFNDFVEVGLLRSALFRAVSTAGPAGVSHEGLEQAVSSALANMGVTDAHYAREPGLVYAAAEQTNAALRSVLCKRSGKCLWLSGAANDVVGAEVLG
jgi:hypothetical protein